jgi:transposase
MVKLIAPEAVKPFVKKGKKNDAADAAAIWKATSRPNVAFVPVKSIVQQGILALHTTRSLLVKQQTMLANAIRGMIQAWPISCRTKCHGGQRRTCRSICRLQPSSDLCR